MSAYQCCKLDLNPYTIKTFYADLRYWKEKESHLRKHR